MAGVYGNNNNGIKAQWNSTHYVIKHDKPKNNKNNKNTGYHTTGFYKNKTHQDNFTKLDNKIATEGLDAEKTLAGIDKDGNKHISPEELSAYLNGTTASSSNLDAIKNQAEAGRTINNMPDSLYNTMIAHDPSKKIDDVKTDLKELFKSGKASYTDVENFLTKKLGWTKEAANAVFFEYVKDNKEIKLSEFLFNIDIYVRDFNENVRGKMPGFDSGEYFQKYTKFNITREHEVTQVFDVAFNSNNPDVKQCREDIAASYAKKYTSSELSLSTNWTTEMKRALYVKIGYKSGARVSVKVDGADKGKGKKKAVAAAGLWEFEHNKILEKYFKELLDKKQAEDKASEGKKTESQNAVTGGAGNLSWNKRKEIFIKAAGNNIKNEALLLWAEGGKIYGINRKGDRYDASGKYKLVNGNMIVRKTSASDQGSGKDSSSYADFNKLK